MNPFKNLTTILFIISHLALAQENMRTVVTSDLMNIASTNALSISPDGNQAVTVVIRKSTKNNNTEYYYTQHLYLLDLKSDKKPAQLNFCDRNDRQPEWSPDGK